MISGASGSNRVTHGTARPVFDPQPLPNITSDAITKALRSALCDRPMGEVHHH
ncbi:MAG: hypothetical protein JNK05_19125 [Myxococcales bacterium]|nr:hypothetical protein [Myxococcales bacterium]